MTDNRIGVARVWILPGNTWSESGWVEERRLIPLSSMSLPSAKGNASFQLLRSLRDDGDGVGMVNDPGMIVPGHWIAVTFGVDAFSFAEVEWWGFIKRSTGVRVEGGDLRGTVEALQVGHLMEDSGVIGWQCATGTGSSYEIEDAPTWNLAHKGGEVVGNIVDVDGSAVFARVANMITGAPAPSRIGTRLDLLLHILTFCSPRNLPAMWADPGDAAAILNDASSPEVIDVREAKFCGAIDLCVTRTRGVAWTVVPESAGWEIACWKDPSDSGNNIDLDSLDETEVRVDETEAAVDEVVVEGGPIIYCGSLSYQDSNLDQGWTAAQETTWKTAVAQNGGENLDDYVERVAQFRSKASLAPVFTRFKVPDVNGSLFRSLDPGDGAATLNFFPKILWDGSTASLSTTDTVDPYWPTTEILRWIPVETDDGDNAQQQWAKPRVFRRDASASAPLDGPVWVDLTTDWKKRHGAAIDIGDHGPSISVKFSPPEILAKGHWSTGSPAPAKLDKLGFTTPDNASVPSHARCIDWQKIVATVAIPGGQRLRVTKWRDGFSASTARRSLLIRNDKLQFWVLHQGAVLDAGNGATPTKQATVSFPRNDYPTAERIATEAAAWSFRERSAITIEMPRPDAAPAWASLGYPIAVVQDGGTTYSCNTCVGSVAIDWSVKRPRITISTVFPERPAAGSGSASPTGGGSVSSSLGGTVAQSARSSAAAVASIVQAAQQVPLIAPRPRSATEPEPLFWMVSQASHGFTVGQPLKLSGSTYALAKADTEANAQVVAIVGAVISTGVFVAMRAGIISGLSGKTAGARYFLDAATAGAVTTTAPDIKVPIYDALSATDAIIAIGGGGGSIPNPLIIGSSTVNGKIQVQGTGPAGDAIVLDASLVATSGKALTIREIDVCDAGVAKKMLVLASATY